MAENRVARDAHSVDVRHFATRLPDEQFRFLDENRGKRGAVELFLSVLHRSSP